MVNIDKLLADISKDYGYVEFDDEFDDLIIEEQIHSKQHNKRNNHAERFDDSDRSSFNNIKSKRFG